MPIAIALAMAMMPAWLMLNRHSVIPSTTSVFAAPPVSRTCSVASGARWITTSEKPTPPPNPVPNALSTASFAANRPAKLSTRLGPLPTSFSSSSKKQRGIKGSRGSSIQRCISAILTRSIPCPTIIIYVVTLCYLLATMNSYAMSKQM